MVLEPAHIATLAELIRAEDTRTFDSTLVAFALADTLPEVRERAALAAGRIADPRATGLLLRALDDPERTVGAAAAFALGLLGDTSAAVVYSLGRRVGVDWAEDDPRAVEAVAALGRLGTPAAYSALRQVLQRYLPGDAVPAPSAAPPQPIGPAGRESLLAIWRFPRAESSLDLIGPHLASADDETRWRATYAMMRIGAARSIPTLLERTRDPNPLVRSLAARALRAPAADSAGARSEAVDALLEALDDADVHVRINAVGALATYGDSTWVPPLRRVLSGDDLNLRFAAVQALSQLPGAAAATALAEVVRDTLQPISIRGIALAGWIRLAPRAGSAEAGEWIASPVWLARLYATRALGGAPWADASRHLRRLAEDGDARVAAAALRTVTALTDTINAPYNVYVQALGSSEPLVRAAAIAGLARRGRAADMPALLDAYHRAQQDTMNAAAIAAVDGLAFLQARGVPAANAFFLRFQPAADRAVRNRVARHFGAENWGEDPPETPRPLEFYEQAVRELVAPELAEGSRPIAVIHTVGGRITVELSAADAPLTVLNFITLATSGYFPRLEETDAPRFRWHRVVPNFVLQDGDSRGDGSGGPGYAIRDEINRIRFRRGVMGMALSGRDTGGSQFFITHSPQPHLDGGFTVFGRVISGMNAADHVVQDDPIFAIEILR